MAQIPVKIHVKQDASLAWATVDDAKLNNIKSDELMRKVAQRCGCTALHAQDIIANALDIAKEEVAEGNIVYLPSTSRDNEAGHLYPVLKGCTIKAGDKDADGNVIPITADSVSNRLSQGKVILGLQLGQKFAETTSAHLQFSGNIVNVKTDGASTDDTPTPDPDGGIQM